MVFKSQIWIEGTTSSLATDPDGDLLTSIAKPFPEPSETNFMT